MMKEFQWFGGQDGFVIAAAVLHYQWLSLTACWRVPHPVRPKTNYDSKVL